jgi:hypothetical protein
LFDGILHSHGGDPTDFLSGLYNVLSACGMPITIFGVNTNDFNTPYVFVPNNPNWLDRDYEDEIIEQIAHDAECIIIVPNKYNLRDPSKISLPPHGNIKICSNSYSVCAVIIASNGHYYTITKQGRYNDVNVTIDAQIMQHFLTHNYDVGDGGNARNGGHVYFFEKIASASSGGKKRGNKRIVATKRNDNNAGQSTTKRNTNHNIKTNRLTKRNNKHGVNVKRRFTKRKRQ